MRVVAGKLPANLLELCENEVLACPDRNVLISAFLEFKAALAKYEAAIEAARQFDWPIMQADTPTSLCHLQTHG